MFSTNDRIEDFDPELWEAIQNESRRQEEHIELIASENYASPRVLEAQGTVLTNKYAEGYPGKDTTEAANLLMSQSSSPSIVQNNYLMLIMSTFSLIPVLAQMRLFTWRY